MYYSIVQTSGQRKGRIWFVSSPSISIGRGMDCEVQIADPTVSRNHCRLDRDGTSLFLTDLESGNLTLVNGAPAASAKLELGDELVVGNTTLMLCGALGQTPDQDTANTNHENKTMILAESQSVFLRSDLVSDVKFGRVEHVDDLALLFEVSRDLGQCQTRRQLVQRLTESIRARLAPEVIWLAQFGTNGLSSECLLDNHREVSTALQGVFDQCVADKKGLLTTSRTKYDGVVSTIACPLIVNGVVIGVVALEKGSGNGVYREVDLSVLFALAHIFAPHLLALENLNGIRTGDTPIGRPAGGSEGILGVSESIQRLRADLRLAAHSDLNVLIIGETGTGKELVAQTIHDISHRAGNPFVTTNCAAIPEQLFESEIFGHEKGAYTSADSVHLGLVEQADGGTLFLDEIGDLSSANQARLLRVLETGTFRRLGGKQELISHFRTISATNKDLAFETEQRRFREDLYYRLDVYRIELSPLRDRLEDIGVLVEHFLANLAVSMDVEKLEVESDALDMLRQHSWPGNVRELRNCIARAAIHTRNGVLDSAMLRRVIESRQMSDEKYTLSLADVERDHIIRILRNSNGAIVRAAKTLGVHRNTLKKKMDEYGIHVVKEGIVSDD